MQESEFVQKWLPIELKNCPNFIIERLGEEAIKELINDNLKTNYQYLVSDERAQKNFDHCQIEGSKAEDYKFRLISSPMGNLVSSIRFIGGDLTKPHVLLVHKDFKLDTAEKVKTIGEILSKEYAIFKPQKIRWQSAQKETTLVEENDFITADLVYIAEFVDNIKARPLPLKSTHLQLKPSKSLEWYETYKTAFDQLLEGWPEYVNMGQLTTEEDFKSMMEKNLVYEVFIEDNWAGIIAAETDSEHFMKGYVMYEELFLKKYRGQKLAPVMQRQFIEKMPADDNQMIYGTIHSDNIASLKTAYRVGRQFAGMYLFAEIVSV